MLLPMPIAPNRAPDGLVFRTVDSAGAVVFEQLLPACLADEELKRAAEIAGDHANDPEGGALWIFDGDTGELLVTYQWFPQ